MFVTTTFYFVIPLVVPFSNAENKMQKVKYEVAMYVIGHFMSSFQFRSNVRKFKQCLTGFCHAT